MARKWIFLALTASLLAACSAAPSQPAPTPTTEPAAATIPAAAPTDTPTTAPTATIAFTSTPAATATPAPSPTATAAPELAVAEQGFRMWCLPEGTTAPADKIEAPQYARVGTFVDTLKVVKVTVPASACTLAYTFNQPLPAGVQLEAYYFYGGTPWATVELTPAPDNPAVGYVTLTQTYVINPPGWSVNYQFVLKKDGKELRTDVIMFNKSVQRCWEGSLPDPVTLRCPASDSREPEPKPGITPSSPDEYK